MSVKKYFSLAALLYLICGCAQYATAQSPQNVIWTNVVNATATGNTLQKTSGCNGCPDAGATSQQTITSGDGYVEFTVGALTGQRFAGLSHDNPGTGWQEIDFAFRLWGNAGPGNLDVEENGTYHNLSATYVVGDVLRVAVESGVVKYYQNGVLRYTSTVAPTYPLMVDTSLLDSNATINNAVIFIPSNTTQNVTWTNIVNATATGNTLQKTSGCNGCPDAGATSQQTITSGDGYVEFTVGALTGQRFAGLSHDNPGTGWQEIDFAFRLWGNAGPGNLDVEENGTYHNLSATYVVGDVLRVAVESGVVKYYQNGVLRYTSTVAPTYPLMVDTSLLDSNATINNAVISTGSGSTSSTLTAPVNAPRAHPLAPNPHTSIGLFWIYTDPTTGRQWTGGTYKVKRCTGASCTPTTVVATGLTHADYQDTGLSTNTTYGYRYLANDGTGDSSDSPIVYVTTTATDDNMVHFPAGAWAELLGPQVEAGQIPFTWYNSAATTTAQTIISKFPVVGPAQIAGTGAITNGSTTLTGTSTFFIEETAANNPTCLNHIMINGVDAGTIASINSNTSITLTSPWTGATTSGATLSTNVPQCNIADPINDYLTGNQLMYYDSPMAMWQIYFRTGDPQYLRGAIKGSESIFAGYMWLGRNRAWNLYSTTQNYDSMPAPRNFQFSGYVLLGMAGHNGVWDLLDDYLAQRYDTWLIRYRAGNNAYQYVREKAYMILFTSWFITAAPDSFPRSNGTTTSLNGTITVDGSLASGRKLYYKTQLDTDVPGFINDDQLPWGFWTDGGSTNVSGDMDYPYTGGDLVGPSQPFIQGLNTDALGYCWRNTALNQATRDAARKEVLKGAAAMGLLSYTMQTIPSDPTHRHRAVWYFYNGGTRLNPYAFQHGGDAYTIDNIPYNPAAPLNREAIPLMLSTFGWAVEMAGGSDSWYKQIGDEMANSAFAQVGENTIGSGADGLKALCDNTSNFKDFGQCFRTTGRYFGHRLATPGIVGTRPVVTMPVDQTLTGGVNQAVLTASVACTNTPCTYRWGLQEFPLHTIANSRYLAQSMFTDNQALSTKLSGMQPGTYKIVFYALDALGLEDHGTVTVTVGDGVFPPVVAIGPGNPPSETHHIYLTTSSSISGAAKAYSAAGRTLTHTFTVYGPKDKTAATLTPSGTTGNSVTFTLSGLSAGVWAVKDTVTDSAGATSFDIMYIRHTAENQPSLAHNTVPTLAIQPNHVLPAGSTSTRLFVVPLDPEAVASYPLAATGYTKGFESDQYLVTQPTHSWTQTSGPVTATITNGNTISPTITGLTASGTYTFRYTGTDQQGDSVQVSINVTVP